MFTFAWESHPFQLHGQKGLQRVGFTVRYKEDIFVVKFIMKV